MSDLQDAARKVLAAYQTFLDTDDLDVLRDSLTVLQEAVEYDDVERAADAAREDYYRGD